MDCGFALWPLSCDVRERPTGQRLGGTTLDCGKLTRIARSALVAGALTLAFGASTASAGPLQTGVLDPAAASRGGKFEINASTAMQAVKQQARGSIVRLYLSWRSVAGPTEPASPANPDQLQLGCRQSPGQRRRGAEQRPPGHADDPLRSRLGAARRPRWTGNAQPGSAEAEGVHARGDAALLRRASLGCLERAELQDLPEPAVPEREARLPDDVSRAPERSRIGDPRPSPEQGGCRRDRAVLALESERPAHRAGPASLPAQAALRGQVGALDVQGEGARGYLRHPSLYVRQRLPSRVQRERRLLRRPAAVEACDQGRVEGEAHHESKRRSRRRPLDHGVQLGQQADRPEGRAEGPSCPLDGRGSLPDVEARHRHAPLGPAP